MAHTGGRGVKKSHWLNENGPILPSEQFFLTASLMSVIEFIHEEISTLFHSEKFYGGVGGGTGIVIIATTSKLQV